MDKFKITSHNAIFFVSTKLLFCWWTLKSEEDRKSRLASASLTWERLRQSITVGSMTKWKHVSFLMMLRKWQMKWALAGLLVVVFLIMLHRVTMLSLASVQSYSHMLQFMDTAQLALCLTSSVVITDEYQGIKGFFSTADTAPKRIFMIQLLLFKLQ